MTKIRELQNEVVERNNFGDFSVCGDDLSLVAAAAILVYAGSDREAQEQLLSEAEEYRETLIELFPKFGFAKK